MGVKKYFQREFQFSSMTLEHENAADFHLTCWQRNRSAVPLFCLRLFALLTCIAIVIASIMLTSEDMPFGHWLLFLTHWGLLLITSVSAFGLFISVKVVFNGPIDATFGLPWYVKAYWICYNVTIPIAFFITLFYWLFLSAVAQEYAFDPTLDVFVHAINSVLMLVLVLCSRHPTRLLHFYWPLALGILYLLFSIIFHFAGGIGPFGTSYIYPMLDWTQPGLASLTAVGSAVAIIVMHLVLTLITVGRDALTKRFRDSNVLNIN